MSKIGTVWGKWLRFGKHCLRKQFSPGLGWGVGGTGFDSGQSMVWAFVIEELVHQRREVILELGKHWKRKQNGVGLEEGDGLPINSSIQMPFQVQPVEGTEALNSHQLMTSVSQARCRVLLFFLFSSRVTMNLPITHSFRKSFLGSTACQGLGEDTAVNNNPTIHRYWSTECHVVWRHKSMWELRAGVLLTLRKGVNGAGFPMASKVSLQGWDWIGCRIIFSN